jgi:uncharacterized protein YtpQ (UPF0354 family)
MNTESKQSILTTHKDLIYPWIKVWIDEEIPDEEIFRLPNDDFPVYQSWLGDLAIFYVADMGDHYQMILKSDLPDGFTAENLHALGIKNLQENITYKIHEAEFGGYGLVCGADLEATSISLPGIWEDVGQFMGENIFVAIASRDLILFVCESEADKLANLKIFVYKYFQEGEKLLSKNIFKYDIHNKEWSVVERLNTTPTV